MSEFITFRSLQKLRFFLAAALPFLARAPRLGETPSKWLERHPRLLKWWTPVRESALASNVRRVATTFALGNYADKQLEWTKIPAESGAVLRAVIVLATLLCLLVPVAMSFAWPALSHETITGSVGAPVAGWSVWLWIVASAIDGVVCWPGQVPQAASRVSLPSSFSSSSALQRSPRFPSRGGTSSLQRRRLWRWHSAKRVPGALGVGIRPSD